MSSGLSLRFTALSALLLGLSLHPARAGQPEVSPAQVVSALTDTFGAHPGERRNHIVGTCASGEFVGLPLAQTYTRSALFSGQPVSVVARFSLAGGNPDAPDTARSPRGLALELRLPDGQIQHMTMLNTPVFGAASPQTFLDDIVAKLPLPATGRPDPDKIKAFQASHPDSRAQAAYLAEHNPPFSWANSSYFSVHAFRFINRDLHVTVVRWRFVPRDGDRPLSQEELATAPHRFLQQRLIERTQRGPVYWDMVMTIGQPGDPQDNPTLAWPSDREEHTIGTLKIVSATPQAGAACERINFDPLVMTDGIAPSNDPVLLFRSPAYAISFGQRMSGH
jgi:catalase